MCHTGELEIERNEPEVVDSITVKVAGARQQAMVGIAPVGITLLPV